MKTAYEALKSGGGKINFAVTVGGYPFILTSTQFLADWLDASSSTADTYKRMMIGSAHSGGTYFADQVKSLPNIIKVGDITHKCDAIEGFDFGSCNIQISPFSDGIDWSDWMTSNTLWGIPGIAAHLSADMDEDIQWGEIVKKIEPDDTTIYLKNWYDFHTWCQGYTGAARYIWINKECMRITGLYAISDGVFGADVVRGCFRTRPSRHLPSVYSEQASIATSCPQGTVANRAGYLWMFAYDDSDGFEFSAPILLHHGPIGSVGSMGSDTVSLNINGFDKWLKNTTKTVTYTDNFPEEYFVLSRHNWDDEYDGDFYEWKTRQSQPFLPAPHLIILEYEPSYSYSYVRKDVWLCDKGDSVVFTSLEELVDALNAELTKMHFSGAGDYSEDSLTYTYSFTINNGLIQFDIPRIEDIVYGYSRVAGQLSIPLCCGFLQGQRQLSVLKDDIRLGNHWWARNLDNYIWREAPGWLPIVKPAISSNKYFIDPKGGIGEATDEINDYISNSSDYSAKGPRDGAKYLLTWNQDVIWSNDSSTPSFCDGWPIPDNSSGQNYLYLQGLNDAGITELQGQRINVGSGVDQWEPYEEAAGSYGSTNTVIRSLYFDVGETSGNSGEYKYCSVDTVLGEETAYSDYSTAPAMKRRPGRNNRIHTYQQLLWHPLVHEEDPWPLSTIFTIEHSNIGSFFLDMFGSTEYLSSVSDHALYDIPDLISENEMNGTIDLWHLIFSTQKIHPNQSYIFNSSVEDGQDIFKLLQSELILHKIQPYIDFNTDLQDLTRYSPAQFQLRFKPIAECNMSKQALEGKIITDGDILRNTTISVDYTSHQPYRDLIFKLDYNYDGEYDYEIEADNSLSSQTAQAAKTLIVPCNYSYLGLASLKDKNDNDFRSYLGLLSKRAGSILEYFSNPQPEYTIQTKLDTAIKLQPGETIVFSSDYAINFRTGEMGVSSLPCNITVVKFDVEKATAKISLTPNYYYYYGLAPNLYIPIGDAEYVDTDEFEIKDCSEHAYTPVNYRTDLSCFDCLDWSRSEPQYIPRDCSCTDYSVRVYSPDPGISPATDVTIGDIDVDDNTATVSGDTSIASLPWGFSTIENFGRPQYGAERQSLASPNLTGKLIFHVGYDHVMRYWGGSSWTQYDTEVLTPIARAGANLIYPKQTDGYTVTFIGDVGGSQYPLGGIVGVEGQGVFSGDNILFQWDGSGTSWSTIDATKELEYAGCDFNGDLICSADSSPYSLYSYDGSTMSLINTPLSGKATAMASIGSSLYAANDELFRYDGNAWVTYGIPSSGNPITSIADYAGYAAVATDDGHVYVSIGGVVWFDLGQACSFYGGYFSGATGGTFLCNHQGILYAISRLYTGSVYRFVIMAYIDGDWENRGYITSAGSTGGTACGLFSFKNRLYAYCCDSNELFYSDNPLGSTTWTTLHTFSSETQVDSLTKYDGDLYVCCTNSTDRGNCYQIAMTDVDFYLYNGSSATDLGYPALNPKCVFSDGTNHIVGDANGNLYEWDTGTTWTNRGNPMTRGNHINDAYYGYNKAFVACDRGYVKYWNGASWSSYSQIGDDNTDILAINYDNDGNLYCVSNYGSLYLYDSGWQFITAADVSGAESAMIKNVDNVMYVVFDSSPYIYIYHPGTYSFSKLDIDADYNIRTLADSPYGNFVATQEVIDTQEVIVCSTPLVNIAPLILRYSGYDHTDLQDCQRYYAYLGDDDGKIYNGTSYERAQKLRR